MKKSNIILPGQRRFGRITLPEFANALDPAAPIGYDRGGAYDKQVGNIMFANDSWFDTTYYSEPLTNYLVGWKDPNNLEATLQFFAPAVTVPERKFEFKAAANAEEFLSEVVDDERAINANFKSVEYTGADVVSKTLNRGLMTIVDLDRVGKEGGMGGSAPPPWQTQRVAKLTRRLYRNSVRRAVAALTAASTATATKHWVAQPVNPDVVPTNPDGDVKSALIAATNISGIRPNRVAYGDSAYLFRELAYGAQNNPAGYQGLAIGSVEEKMAAALQVDQVLVSKERYQSSSAAKSEVLGQNVLAFYAEDDVDTEDPSNIKRFVSTFNSEQGGGLFRVYVQQISAKLVAISVEFYEIIVITYNGGIVRIPVLNS
jgi:hypothetical protein